MREKEGREGKRGEENGKGTGKEEGTGRDGTGWDGNGMIRMSILNESEGECVPKKLKKIL